jgi:phosphohistidine phosphatase
MRIGILRHGIAEDHASTGADYDRRLTREGEVELEHHLDLIQAFGWTPSIILYSPLVRTTQTAYAVAARLPGVPTEATDVIPLGLLDEILQTCAPHRAPLIIGHEPTLGRLVARLLHAPSSTTPFERAGFALLDVDRIPVVRPARMVLFLPPRQMR